ERSGDGVAVRVHPALAPLGHPLSETMGATNALFIEGKRIGRIFIQGPGAGSGPTAAAVAADIADVMTGAVRPVFQSPAAGLAPFNLVGRGDERAADQVAVDAMRSKLNTLEIQGLIVIGEGERDEAPMLYIGEKVGRGKGPKIDIALDPLEGTTLTAKASPG